MHKHHIVFRSQGGLTFPLNLIELSYEQHEGNDGPHRNKEVDIKWKKDLQAKLFEIFHEEGYTIEQIAQKLGRSVKYFEKPFRKVRSVAGVYHPWDIVKKLMGGRFY